MKKNLVSKLIALVSCILIIVAIILNNTVGQYLALAGVTALFVLTIVKWIVPDKKNMLFKTLITLALYLFILTWIIPSAAVSGSTITQKEIYRMSLYSVLEYPWLTVQYFLQQLLFLLAVGGLYGILKETGKYRSILETVAKSMKGKETVFLIIVAFVLAALSSVFGFNLYLFIFIPALAGIILLMGYDKITAFAVTFVAPLVGIIGATYNDVVVYYINQVIATEYTTEIIAKIGLFVLSFVVFISFVLKHAKENKSKANELSEKVELFLGEKKTTKKSPVHIIIVFACLFVLLILGYTNWSRTFGVEIFNDFYKTITEWTIRDSSIVSYLLGELKAFGTWQYEQFTVLIVLASILLSVIYKLKLNDAVKAFGKGIVRLARPILMFLSAYTIVVIIAYHPIIVFVTDKFAKLVGTHTGILGNILFILVSVLNTMFSSIFNIDMLYMVQSTVPYLNAYYADSANSLAIITQSIYGLTSMVAPTSILLVLGLEYLEIPYKDWLKSSWKMLLCMLAVILVVICVVVFI